VQTPGCIFVTDWRGTRHAAKNQDERKGKANPVKKRGQSDAWKKEGTHLSSTSTGGIAKNKDEKTQTEKKKSTEREATGKQSDNKGY